MKKIAAIQCRRNPASIEREQYNISHTIGDLAEVTFLSALDEGLPWNSPTEMTCDFDGLILGGSSDFDFHGSHESHDDPRVMAHSILYRLENVIKYALRRDIPVIGICFGHQLIGHTFGAECVHDKAQSKYGSFDVHVTEEGKKDAIFSQLPPQFKAQYAHKDSLTRLPDGATLLAESPVCNFGALRYGKSMYTFQFHPEVIKFQDPYPHEPSPEASKIIPLWIKEFVGR
jgi:GMP synthase-like glutamine amidotransferase